MKLILNNWLAKLMSLVLAVILWWVIKQSLEKTGLPSRFQFQSQEKFKFDTSSSYGSPKKK